MTYHDTAMVLENFIPSETLPAWTEGTEGLVGGCWTRSSLGRMQTDGTLAEDAGPFL